MYELIYGNKSVRQALEKQYPDAKFEDASDDVHPERFAFESNQVAEDEFYPFVMKEGFALTCLRLQLMLRDGRKEAVAENKPKIEKWMAIAEIAD